MSNNKGMYEYLTIHSGKGTWTVISTLIGETK